MGSGSSKLTTEQRIRKLPYVPQKKVRDYAISSCGSGVTGDFDKFILRLHAFTKVHHPLDKLGLEMFVNYPRLSISGFLTLRGLFTTKSSRRNFRSQIEDFFGSKFDFEPPNIVSQKTLSVRPPFRRMAIFDNYILQVKYDYTKRYIKIVNNITHEISEDEFKRDVKRLFGGCVLFNFSLQGGDF
jgi:hypothetical protein